MIEQIKNSFDNPTLRKILKSFGWCLLSGAGAFLVAISQGIAPLLALQVASGVMGTLILNTIVEYREGELVNEEKTN